MCTEHADVGQGRTGRRRLPTRARRFIFAALLVLLSLAMPVRMISQTLVKSIEGKVLNDSAAPLPGSIIYLQDMKTNVIKTLIATADGVYRFGQLPADTDYQIWAEFKGKASKKRLISSFDTKRDVNYDFHISDK